MMMRFRKLEQRVTAMEKAGRGVCNCRAGQATRYHTAADLAEILSIHCPVHDVRDLGCVLWLPPSSPLRSEDRDLSSCLPCAAREWREGRRGPLTEAEWEQEYRSWEEQLSVEAIERFRHDQTRAKQLLQRYERRRRKKHGEMPGNNQGGKTL